MATSSAASTKRKLGEILKVLEKAYGKVHALSGQPPLDHAIYLILRDQWDYRKATRALHFLQREYVDWNEVRVTTAGELKGALGPFGDRDIDVKIEKVRTLLDSLYRERNCAHLNFLTEMDVDGQRRFLAGLGVLTPAHVQILIQILAGEQVVLAQGTTRVLSRVGLIPRVGSPTAARKHLDPLLTADELFAAQAHLVQHGEEICLSKSPRCGECGIVTLCGFKRKVGVASGT